MIPNDDKSRMLADLEYLEQHIVKAVPEELYENASQMYNLAARNIGKLSIAPDDSLKSRYISIVNKIIKYRPNPTPEESTIRKTDAKTTLPETNQIQNPRKDFGKFEKIRRYISKKRWNSFFHQIEEIISSDPDSVLEIGLGTGLLRAVLKDVYKCNYESLDIIERNQPDYIGSVIDLPFLDKSYDVVVCYEVLEHLPYENFEKALSEIFRVAKSNVVISLPNAGSSRRPNQEHIFNGEHYWEINKIGYEQNIVIDTIQRVGNSHGFELVNNYRVVEYLYHHFFVLNYTERGKIYDSN